MCVSDRQMSNLHLLLRCYIFNFSRIFFISSESRKEKLKEKENFKLFLEEKLFLINAPPKKKQVNVKRKITRDGKRIFFLSFSFHLAKRNIVSIIFHFLFTSLNWANRCEHNKLLEHVNAMKFSHYFTQSIRETRYIDRSIK